MKRFARRPTSFFGVAILASLGLLASGCGGAKSPVIANVGTTTSSSRAAGSTNGIGGTAGSGSTAPGAGLLSAQLAYAKCMRSNGVPNFPDPNGSGGFQLGAGTDPSSPTFKAAQAKCQKLLPGAGPPGSGSPPSAQAVAQMLKVSQCMRRHGISGFPDPTTSIPPNLAAIGYVSDRDGVILVFPHTLDTQSPAFTRAAAACRFQLTNH